MDVRSLGRYLAPLALIAVLVATVVVISSVAGGGENGSERAKESGTELSEQERRRRRERRRERAERKTYTVRQGDTLEMISQRTRVPRDDIIRLNPDLDAQALQPGQKIKLR